MKPQFSINLNNFSVQIEGADILQREDGAYFAAIEHEKNFAVVVKSNWGYGKSPFECEMTLNGEYIGTFQKDSQIRVETKPGSGKKLIALVKGSVEAYQAGQAMSQDNDIGLIKLVMYPSIEKKPTLLYDDMDIRYKGNTRSFMSASPMQIGLQGKSDQQFKQVEGIERDYANRTTVYVRLIEKNHRIMK